MGDDAIQYVNFSEPQPPRRKSRRGGCLGWTCGCLAGLAVIVVTLGLILGLVLNRWDPLPSAWENMPPATNMAVEFHDLRTLLRRSLADPGLMRLSQKHLAALEEAVASLEGQSTPPKDFRTVYDFADYYRKVGFLHRIFFPNNLIVYSTATNPGEHGFILQAPTWLGWLLHLDEPDQIRPYHDEESGVHFFYTHHEGWLMVGFSEELLQETLANWSAQAKPLGPRAAGGETRVYGALRLAAESSVFSQATDAPPPPANLAPEHFAFADPFAAATKGLEKLEHEEVIKSVRVLIQPALEGWNVSAEAGEAGLFAAGQMLTDTVAETLGDHEVVAPGQDWSDLSVFFQVAPDLMETWRIKSARLARDASFTNDAIRSDLAWKWLHDAWFAKISGEGWLRVGPPALPAGMSYPPLPVLALGWRIRDGIDPADAGKEFNNALERWQDGARSLADVGSQWRDGEHFGAHFTTDADGEGGGLNLPPVMVNGARPVWQFYHKERTAWLASDPSGMPLERGDLLWPGGKASEPKAGWLAAAGGWRIRPEFLDALGEWFRDRYSLLPAKRRLPRGDEERLDNWADKARDFLQAFPKGCFRLNGNVTGTKLVGKAYVPKGVGE